MDPSHSQTSDQRSTDSASPSRKRAAIITNRVTERVRRLYNSAARRRISESFDLYPEFLTYDDFVNGNCAVDQIEVLFGTWGFPALDTDEIARFKSLQHVFFGAGSIKRFGLPILQAGIPLCSAKRANAKIVADFCLGQILLGAKGYFQNIALFRDWENGVSLKDKIYEIRGYSSSTIALIGCGIISRLLIQHLKQRDFKLKVVDPYLTEEECSLLGVEKVGMEEAFSESEVVSNHLPNLSNLRGVIGKRLLERMPRGATFINTGRGAQVNEAELGEVYAARPDLVALLDVSDPEPPLAGSPLYSLSNVHLSSHIAGCIGDEVDLLVGEAIGSAEKWLRGEPLDNLETLERFNLTA